MQIRRWLPVLLFALATPAWAANSNQTLNVQGVLRDGTGALQSTAVGLVVNIYSSQSAATPAYTQSFATVPVANGFFTVELSGPSLSFVGMADAWIGVQVAGDSAELPRQHIDASPYAFTAASADSLGGVAAAGYVQKTDTGFQTDGQTAPGTISTTSTTLGDTNFPTWSVTVPTAKTYLLAVDVSAYETGALGAVYWQVVATQGATVVMVSPVSARTLPQALAQQTGTSFHAALALPSSGTWTIKLQWRILGNANESGGINPGCFRVFTLIG